jgi:hypothetical protein
MPFTTGVSVWLKTGEVDIEMGAAKQDFCSDRGKYWSDIERAWNFRRDVGEWSETG